MEGTTGGSAKGSGSITLTAGVSEFSGKLPPGLAALVVDVVPVSEGPDVGKGSGAGGLGDGAIVSFSSSS